MNDSLKIERRNVYIGNRRTTLALEQYFWKILEGISFDENKTIDEILTSISEALGKDDRLTPTIRYIVNQTMMYQAEGETGNEQMGESPPKFPSAFHQAMDSLNDNDPQWK